MATAVDAMNIQFKYLISFLLKKAPQSGVSLWGNGFSHRVRGFDEITVDSLTAADHDRASFFDADDNRMSKGKFDRLAEYVLSIEDDWLL